MKILLINKYYYLKGGSETVFFDLKKLLESDGHEVMVFAMKHSQNQQTEFDRFFVDQIDFQKKEGLIKGLKKALNYIWNFQSAKNLEDLITEYKPDIAHIHNFIYHLTPSILTVLKKHNIPIIQTVHAYALLSPNYSLFARGQVCPIEKKFPWYKIFVPSCPQSSYVKSLLAGAEFYLRKRFKWYESKIDRFITPSLFLKTKLEQAGISQPIEVINNGIDTDSFEPNYQPGSYVLCVTRFSREKGIDLLVEATVKTPDIKYKIIGDGPLFDRIQDKIIRQKLTNIELLGYKTLDQVYEYLEKCRFLVIPSQGYENYPMVVLEAMAMGKPVLGSNLGGIPELVVPEQTGWLFKPGNVDDLSLKLAKIWPELELIESLGKQARAQVEQQNNSQILYKKLKIVYNKLLGHDTQMG